MSLPCTQAATGFGPIAPVTMTTAITLASPPASSFPYALITAANTLANTGVGSAHSGATGTVTLQSVIPVVAPAQVWPDLQSVYCASKNLCFAVGGFSGLAMPRVDTITAAATLPLSTAGALGTYATVLRSINGGTAWSVRCTPVPAGAPICPLVFPCLGRLQRPQLIGAVCACSTSRCRPARW